MHTRRISSQYPIYSPFTLTTISIFQYIKLYPLGEKCTGYAELLVTLRVRDFSRGTASHYDKFKTLRCWRLEPGTWTSKHSETTDTQTDKARQIYYNLIAAVAGSSQATWTSTDCDEDEGTRGGLEGSSAALSSGGASSSEAWDEDSAFVAAAQMSASLELSPDSGPSG